MRWIGIDEAGYGPNLGPLVMSAVVAESEGDQRPNLWGEPAQGQGQGLARAGGPLDQFWLDDSKALYRGGNGLDRLEAATLAVLVACGLADRLPAPLETVLGSLGVASLDEAELSRWLSEGGDLAPLPSPSWSEQVARWLQTWPTAGVPWRVVGARSVVLGPESFNALLDRSGNKSHVHAAAFARLLRWAWDRSAAEGQGACIRVDKHGGRHFYADLLARCLPEADVWVQVETPTLSRYELTGGPGRFLVEFAPRADAGDGLVALASIVSKTLRERWMAVFNAYWACHLPGLLPTAGYPTDARRFRTAIEPLCEALDLPAHLWWRAK